MKSRRNILAAVILGAGILLSSFFIYAQITPDNGTRFSDFQTAGGYTGGGNETGTVRMPTGTTLLSIECPSGVCFGFDGIEMLSSLTGYTRRIGSLLLLNTGCWQVTTGSLPSGAASLFIPDKLDGEWDSFVQAGSLPNPYFSVATCPAALLTPVCDGNILRNPAGLDMNCTLSGKVCCDAPLVSPAACMVACPAACPANCSALTELVSLPANSTEVTTSCADPDGGACNCTMVTGFDCNDGWHEVGNSCVPDCANLCSDLTIVVVPANATGTMVSCSQNAGGPCNDLSVPISWTCNSGYEPDGMGGCKLIAAPPTTCPAATMGRCEMTQTPVGSEDGVCMAGFAGSCSYICNAGGTWSLVSSDCDPAVSCPATTINNCSLDSTTAGGSDGSCASGYSGSCNYACSLTGTWSVSTNTCALVPGCPASTLSNCVRSATANGGTSGTCASGYDGTCSYTCTSGVWGAPSSNLCKAMCQPTVISNCNLSLTMPAGFSGTCASGYTGVCQYTCSNTGNGVWGAPSSNSCVPSAVPVCTDGATTTTGCNQTGACAGAIKTCSANAWGPCSKLPGVEICGNGIDEDCNGSDLACPSCAASTLSNCVRSATASGGTSGTCASGSTGACSYTCNSGTWGAPSSNTCKASCPAQTIGYCVLPATVNGVAGGSCASGSTGACSFTCNDGSWTLNSNTCTVPPVCTATTINHCQVGNSSVNVQSGTCESGYTNYCSYVCQAGGSWQLNFNDCGLPCMSTSANNCVRDFTDHGGSDGICASGYAGSCSYTCNNGSWSLNTNSCASLSCTARTISDCVLPTTANGVTRTGTCSGSGFCSYRCDSGSWTEVDNSCVPSGCFVAGTKILMADGSLKPIQKVRQGDVVQGLDGHNTVERTIVIRHEGWLYSINGGGYFVTEVHPFMTKGGIWKAFNPEAAIKLNPDLVIEELKVGDVIIARTSIIPVTKLDRIWKKQKVYNFVVNNSHVYYADGYLVHNKIACTGTSDNPGCPLGYECVWPACLEHFCGYCCLYSESSDRCVREYSGACGSVEGECALD